MLGTMSCGYVPAAAAPHPASSLQQQHELLATVAAQTVVAAQLAPYQTANLAQDFITSQMTKPSLMDLK
jgi:hypothetical protein